MRVAIVGAGFSGIAAARVLRALDIEVTVFDRTPDVGGVWSSTRSYPGVSTQNDKHTYAFSDLPMPEEYPEYPSGSQVRQYLEGYVDHHGLRDAFQLETSVERAEPVGTGWRLTLVGPDGSTAREFDAVVAALGVFSDPYVPSWTGSDEFRWAGGEILTPAQVPTAAVADGRDVVIVGWGKTACDLAVAVADRAASTTMIARTMRWKVPRRLGPIELCARLMHSRAGEFLLWYTPRSVPARAAFLPVRVAKRLVASVIERLIVGAEGLRPLGLVPDGRLPNVISQPSTGLWDRIREGRVAVRRGAIIERLGRDPDGTAVVQLQTGERLTADIVIAATGYQQRIDFLAPEVVERLTDADGAVRLHHGIAAAETPGLYFTGFADNILNSVGAEVNAIWIGAAMSGLIPVPSRHEPSSQPLAFYLTQARAAMAGESQVPGRSFQGLDALLAQAGFRLPLRARVRQWLHPADPAVYREALPRLVAAVRTKRALEQVVG